MRWWPELGRRFRLLDEGWSTSPAGYTDRKVLVQAPTGPWPRSRSPPRRCGRPERRRPGSLHGVASPHRPPSARAAEAQSRAFYAAAMERAESSWNNVGGITSGPNTGSNVARQTASDITPPVFQTSPSSTFDRGHRAPARRTPYRAACRAGRDPIPVDERGHRILHCERRRGGVADQGIAGCWV